MLIHYMWLLFCGVLIISIITLQLPEPFSFIFTWFAALTLILFLAQSITNFIVKDFLILRVGGLLSSRTRFNNRAVFDVLSNYNVFDFQGPCPNCGTENISFFGTILSISNGGSTNTIKCSK